MSPMHGPIDTTTEWIPGNPSDFEATEGGVYDGEPGLPKGSGGKAKELTYEEGGAFGKVPQAEK